MNREFIQGAIWGAIIVFVIASLIGCAGMQDRCTKDEVAGTYYKVCRASTGEIESYRLMTVGEVQSHKVRKERSEGLRKDLLTNPMLFNAGVDLMLKSVPEKREYYLYRGE